MDKIKHILSWNIRGFNANKEELHLLLSNKPLAVCLQENIVPNDKEIHLPGYTILKTNTNRGNALCIRSDCLYTTVSLNTPIVALAVRILLHKTITICSVYISPSKTDLINLANQQPVPFLILGDFNGHSPRWGSPDSNIQGKIIEDFLDDLDLCVLNNGDPPIVVPVEHFLI